MQEERVVDTDDRIVTANPLSVLPVGTESNPMFKISQWVTRFPFLSVFLVDLHTWRRLSQLFSMLLEELLPDSFRVGVPESSVLFGCNVAKVTIDIHGFMVADK